MANREQESAEARHEAEVADQAAVEAEVEATVQAEIEEEVDEAAFAEVVAANEREQERMSGAPDAEPNVVGDQTFTVTATDAANLPMRVSVPNHEPVEFEDTEPVEVEASLANLLVDLPQVKVEVS